MTARHVSGVLRATVALLLLYPVPAAHAQGTARDLTRSSIEDLMNVQVTSASRKEERAGNVAAAVYVITQDEIRRSGLRSVPELLRLVPGVQVARLDATKWAVSVRGFNDLYSNKLLVLIDGRSIYNGVFSGVLWGTAAIMPESIERIEVVRGPGGATWGANAVNGVINIVTKRAADAQGVLVTLSGGSVGDVAGGLRYGGRRKHLEYRLSSMWSGYGPSALPAGGSAGDAARTLVNVVQADWARGAHTVSFKAAARGSETDTPLLRPFWVALAPLTGADTASHEPGRSRDDSGAMSWTRTVPESELRVQASVTRRDVKTFREHLLEYETDLDVEYSRQAGARHELVAGGGVRRDRYEAEGSYVIALTGEHERRYVVNLFAEDQVRVHRRARLTAGARLERASATGWSLQPTGRFIWDVVPDRHHVWLAASRAVRTPSALDLDLRLRARAVLQPGLPPVVIGVNGNSHFAAERFADVEAGYRFEIGSRAGLDVTGFRGRYQRLPTSVPEPPVLESVGGTPYVLLASRLENLFDAATRGVEASGFWSPVRVWRLDASYSRISLRPISRRTGDPLPVALDGNAPDHQWQIRSSLWLTRRLEASGALYRVGALPRLAVPSYTRVDARLEFRVDGHWSLVGTGQNLLQARHQEFGDALGVTAAQVRRGAGVQLIWHD